MTVPKGKPNDDRRVHAISDNGVEVVRYERAGKWYFEREGEQREAVTVAQAAAFTVDLLNTRQGKIVWNVLGGRTFESHVRGRLRGDL